MSDLPASVSDITDQLNGVSMQEGAQNSERIVLKFLVPNVAAGTIIGKAGSNITEIQTDSEARVQVRGMSSACSSNAFHA